MPMTPDDDFAENNGNEARPRAPRMSPRRRAEAPGDAAAGESLEESADEEEYEDEEFAGPPDSVKNLVADNPVAALIVAFISGILVGRMLF